MPVITLLTDFGLSDAYVGIMKGVILGICPQAQIADLTHLIRPQDVFEGAMALGRATPFFPPGTIHVAVVDPGVGTLRRPLAAKINAHFFIGPDNGLCTVLVEQARRQSGEVQFIHLNRPEFWLTEVSSVFHGRDIFAPVAGHLANGISIDDLGTPIDDPILLVIPVPKETEKGWRGQVLQIDHFGNLSTNLTLEQIVNPEGVKIKIGDVVIHGLVHAFGEKKPGEIAALIDSSGKLSINVVNGDAAQLLGIQVGDPVEVITG